LGKTLNSGKHKWHDVLIHDEAAISLQTPVPVVFQVANCFEIRRSAYKSKEKC